MFLYNTPNEAFKILEDKKFEALAIKIDYEFLFIKKELKEMRDSRRDNHALQIYTSDDTPGDVAVIEEDAIEPILTMLNPNLINSNSPIVKPFLKDFTVHIPYMNAKTFVDDVLPNPVGDKESSNSVRIGRMTKRRSRKMTWDCLRNPTKSRRSMTKCRINASLDQFHRCLNEEMVAVLRYFNSLELETLPPHKKSILKNMNMLAPGMYKLDTDNNQARTSQLPQDSRKTNKRVSFSTGVIPKTSVSRTQLKSNPIGDRVMRNNSQGKKQEVENQSRNVKLPKNKTSVTACNDSLNAKTLNVNYVSAMCDKCVLIDKHDMCVLNSVVKPSMKTVASESNQKPRNITRKLYERLVEIFLFIVDSGCSKHMTGNLKLLINFVEKFLGTVKFENDQIAPILGYGDLVQGAVTIKRVYYVEGLNHNLCFASQLCYADLEVAFRKSTCYIRDLKGNDLLIEGIPHQTSVARTPEQNGVVERQNRTLVDAARTMLSAAKVPLFFWNGVVERLNRTLVEAARTMLSSAKVPLFFWAEAIATACFTQNRTTSNELDLLFSLMFDELLNGSSKVISKPSAVSVADAPNQRQQLTTPLNNHTTPVPTC
nr:integrase, catalytic region, zinc finger, CCHC-type, peptidase aspartic, catalytic [Tanacetum cinerariifolium]